MLLHARWLLARQERGKADKTGEKVAGCREREIPVRAGCFAASSDNQAARQSQEGKPSGSVTVCKTGYRGSIPCALTEEVMALDLAVAQKVKSLCDEMGIPAHEGASTYSAYMTIQRGLAIGMNEDAIVVAATAALRSEQLTREEISERLQRLASR